MNTTSHTFKFRYTILRHNKYPKVYRPKVNTLLKAISTKKEAVTTTSCILLLKNIKSNAAT